MPTSSVTGLPTLMVIICLSLVGCGQALEGETSAGSRLTLPPGVTVPDDFERDESGLAVDLVAAEERYYQCMEDSGYPVAGLDIDELMARTGDNRDEEFRLIHMLCYEAAGTGWAPGNRPDEAAARNRQAWATTECVRRHGLDWPDPRPDEWNRYLVFSFDHETLFAVAGPDEASIREASSVIGRCVDEHAIDWEQWLSDNPRN